MSKYILITDKINSFIKISIGVFIGVMALIISLQIFSRALFDYSLSWSEELARYLSIYAVFLGAAVAIRSQKLISVEIIHQIIPTKVSRILKILVNIICIIFFLVLFTKGIEMIIQVQNQKSPALQISMAIPYAAIPIGSILLSINSLAVIFELFKKGELE